MVCQRRLVVKASTDAPRQDIFLQHWHGRPLQSEHALVKLGGYIERAPRDGQVDVSDTRDECHVVKTTREGSGAEVDGVEM